MSRRDQNLKPQQQEPEKLERVHLVTKIEREYGLKNKDGDVVRTFVVQAVTSRSSQQHWNEINPLLEAEANKKQLEIEQEPEHGNSQKSNQ